MIPFFRKIRKQLARDNKFFQYSRYAIGEIALVVVGILIALQINNWNEWRKDREKEHIILLSLSENLQRNNKILLEGLGGIHNLNNSSRIVFDLYNDKIRYKDSLDNHFWLASLNGVMQGGISAEGYENYKNAGFDIILSNTLKTSVLYLFEVEYPKQDAFRQLLSEGVDGNNREYIRVQSQYFSRSKVLDINNLLKDNGVYEWYLTVYKIRTSYEGLLNVSLEETERVLQLIKEELQKK